MNYLLLQLFFISSSKITNYLSSQRLSYCEVSIDPENFSQVQGVECIYGCYVHSAILPTFHRRCYWLLQNPDVVLVHYLNVPYPDGDAKLAALPPCLALPPDKKEWTRDELASQLRPMFLGGDDDPNNPHLSQHSNHPVDMIVSQLLDRQRASSASSTSSAQIAPRRLTPDNQVIILDIQIYFNFINQKIMSSHLIMS